MQEPVRADMTREGCLTAMRIGNAVTVLQRLDRDMRLRVANILERS